jgi:undecaprenyl-diphosphatase
MSNRMRFYLNRMYALDSAVCVTVSHSNQYLIIRNWFRLISRLGDGIFWYMLMFAIIIVQQAEGIKPVLHMLAAGFTGTLVYKWLKAKTHRPRPFQVRQDVWVVGTPLDKFSFPSGHTLHAVVFSVVAIYYYPQLAIVLLPFSVMVAMSRVILGLHYPSDVLAGAFLGYVIAFCSILLLL